MSDSLIACPKCGARYDGTRVRPGAKVRCTKCKSVFAATVPVQPPADKLVGRKIGGYEVLAKIGVGGIGAVYRARQLSLDRIVAFKTLKPEFAQNKAFVDRLKREARSSAQISHTNIVQTYDVGQDQGVSFIAMEFVEGQTLQDKLAREGGVQIGFAVDLLEQSAKALVFAQQAGIVHRDIKPENLMITKDGTIKVADFGLAKRIDVDVSLTQSGTIVGTPRYMSPEQGNGEPLDFRSDIYSLGASVYHALAGVPPFDAPTAMAVIVKHINEPLPPLRAQSPRVPPKLARVIERMMAKDPADRYQTPDELLAAIEDVRSTLAADMAAVERGEVQDETLILGAVDPTARTEPGGTRPVKAGTKARRRGRRALVWALAALGIIVLLLAVKHGLREKKFEKEVEADFEKCVAAAQEYHNEERFQDAINAFDGFPPDGAPNYDAWKEKAQEQRDRYLGFARKKFETEARKAEDAVENQEFSQARAIYDEILESFGVPKVLDEAQRRRKAVVAKQEKTISQVLKELEREIQTNGTDSVTAQDLYGQIRLLKGDARLSAPLEGRVEKIAEQIREERGGAKVLTVSKKGNGDYRSLGEALKRVFKDDTIEIRDSEVYEEAHLSTNVRNVTIRGAAGESPVIRPKLMARGGKGGVLQEFLMRFPAVRVTGGCTIENIVLDLSKTTGGILLQGDGELTLRSSAILGIRTFGVAVGGKGGAKGEKKRASLKVTDCIFTAVRALQRGGGPRVMALNYGDHQRIDLEFTHNVVCGGVAFAVRPVGDANSRLMVDSNIFQDIGLLTLSMGPSVRGPKTFFDYNCYSNGPKDFYGEMRELRGPRRLRRPMNILEMVGRVSRFEEWCEQTKGDKHSILKPAGLRSPKTGDFRLVPDSPCIGRGRDRSNIGLLTARVIPSKLFPAAKKPPLAQRRPSDTDRPSREDIARAETRIKELLEQQRYDQAIEAVHDVMAGVPGERRRVHNIEVMKDLKLLVIDRINAGAKPPLPQTLVKQEPYAHLTGGSIARATRDSFTATDKTDERSAPIAWGKLTGEEFIAIAKKCTDIQNGHEQLMLGVYCFELKLWDKAKTYLRFAKISRSVSDRDHRMAEDLLRMAEGLDAKEQSSTTAPPRDVEEAEDRADAYMKVQEAFEDKKYKNALDKAGAYVKQNTENVRLRLRMGSMLWEHYKTVWESRDPVSPDVRARWLKMIWQLLRSGVEEGDKLPGKRDAQKVLEKVERVAKKMGVALPSATQR